MNFVRCFTQNPVCMSRSLTATHLCLKVGNFMRAIVIGGTGHIGTYLVPRLVRLGYEVVNISRSQRDPYHLHGAWKEVTQVQIDRRFKETAGTFGKKIRDLKPEIVIDLICFTLESARHLAAFPFATRSYY
jgi:nucleoside-diphosphate-sugar epimerase